MKIVPRLEIDQVFKKSDTADQQERDRREQQKNDGSKQENAAPETLHVTDEELNQAINSVAKDPDFVAQGLHVEQNAARPGLKIALIDREGRKIRDMSGEEFVRLRDTVQNNGKKSGKLLDKKV